MREGFLSALPRIGTTATQACEPGQDAKEEQDRGDSPQTSGVRTMSIKRYGTPTKPGAVPFSKASEAAGWLFVSGQVPRDANGDIVSGSITVQARVTLENLKNVLESAGYSLEDVVRVNVFLDDTRDFAEFNRVYTQFFSVENAPARVCVQASMMNDLRVEVDCIAYKAN